MNSTHEPDVMRCIVVWLKYRSTFDKKTLLLNQMTGSKVKVLKGNSDDE
jgi:hypothetical protein